ncbi:iron chaperone [Planococcus sp. YIM B11945]|uniref:iron chaperone n=1 Tax=Planococcus sp. YIM B11945 TaxID=3435410 RepID=UPI003D7ECDDC
METNNLSFNSVDDYMLQFSPEIQEKLQILREIVKEEAPEAQETIKYAMPTFVLNGNLLHFAAFKHHIGFYPTPNGIDYFKDRLAVYKNAKGSVQFPLDEPLPYELIREIIQFRVNENRKKGKKHGSQ